MRISSLPNPLKRTLFTNKSCPHFAALPMPTSASGNMTVQVVMHKPIVRWPKLRAPYQAIIKQTQRVPLDKRNTFAPNRLAASFYALKES